MRTKFSQADLTRAKFAGAYLESCDFRQSNLTAAEFYDAQMPNARFGEAILRMADLSRVNLTGARELTSQQLGQARTTTYTVLPNGSHGPYLKGSAAERPERR